MTDEAIGWLGYNAFDTPARVAWKQITRKLSVNLESGIAEYKRLLKEDRATVAPLSRNLGYYNKFRGFVAEAEPFYRVAVELNDGDADLYEVWAESLQASGEVDAATRISGRVAQTAGHRRASFGRCRDSS